MICLEAGVALEHHTNTRNQPKHKLEHTDDARKQPMGSYGHHGIHVILGKTYTMTCINNQIREYML
jgi:hypothetical protein